MCRDGGLGVAELDGRLKGMIAGAVAEVDPAQIAVLRQISPAQKVQQALSMIHIAERVGAYRLRLRQPQLNETQALQFTRKSDQVWERVREMADSSTQFEDFMRLVIDALEAAEIDYLIGGAVAVWAWGELRTTGDFDVVVSLPIERMQHLSQELNVRDMLVPPDIMLDLLVAPGDLPINAIHMPTGYKAEFFLLRPGDALRASALQRRLLVDLGPPLGEVYVHAPEDLILYKLHYFGLSQQPKHVRDIASMVETLGDELDMDYIQRWVERLDLNEVWQEVWRQIVARR